MCGRFVGYSKLETLIDHFPIDVADVAVVANFNVAPSQEILGIVRRDNRNLLEKFHWGLVPFWAKDTGIGNRMINARSETAAGKPSYRAAFRRRRCLIIADGFYEWQGEQGRKQPLFLTLPDGKPFAFAGLWEVWDNQGKARPYRSCTILTRPASASVRPIHHRMPVILQPEAFDAWLNPDNRNVASLQGLIEKKIYTKLSAIRVSRQVNSVKNNGPENVQPV